ncbi:MAG: NINE protein, partial [Coleofasciculus sp. C2-GNP5-27]
MGAEVLRRRSECHEEGFNIIKVWRSSVLMNNGVLSSGVRITMLSKPKSRKVASLLAFSGVVIPIAGLHKFYLGQPWWGVLYLLLSW